MYEKGQWWGFYQLWLDWKGSRWMLPILCKWYKGELPIWLINEEIDESKIMEINSM